jgi:urea transport system substrate-binding protein
MAISETTLKDTMLMLIDGSRTHGDLGRPAGQEAGGRRRRPASDWPLFAEKARELLTVQEVDVIFGNWTSSSRKSVLPVIEELNGIVFYPVQYEGEESSKNVFYTGAAPNQQAIPATTTSSRNWASRNSRCWAPTMSIRAPPTTSSSNTCKDKGIPQEDIFVNYTPFGHSDWSKIVADVVALGADGKKVGVISTINGDANVGFYKELAAQGISADDIPVVAFSVGEEELSGLDTEPTSSAPRGLELLHVRRHAENEAFIAAWHAFMGDERVTNDPMEAHYIGFNMWVNAVEAAGTTDVTPCARRCTARSSEPDRRHGRDAAEPPPDQAGADRRDPGRRPVRHHQPDRAGAGRRLDRLPAGIRRAEVGLARARLRHVQHRDRDLRAASVELLRRPTPARSRQIPTFRRSFRTTPSSWPMPPAGRCRRCWTSSWTASCPRFPNSSRHGRRARSTCATRRAFRLR